MKDIDNIIAKMDEVVKNTNSIDAVCDASGDINVDNILRKIDSLAENMREPKGRIAKRPIYEKIEASYTEYKLLKRILIKFDKVLQKNRFYEERVRPRLKSKLRNFTSKRIVDGKQIMAYDGVEFVEILYKSILLREVDGQARKKCVRLLDMGEASKLDLIDSLMNSEEARKINIRVSNLTGLRFKRRLNRIPLLNYGYRWIRDIIYFPKKIDEYEQFIRRYEGFLNQEKQEKERKVQEEKLSKEMMDMFYLHYNEKLLPDSREKVKNRSIEYIERLDEFFDGQDKKSLSIVDLGCGECEWIELLNEHGYKALGVDSNQAVIEKMHRLLPEIEIQEDNAYEYLIKEESESKDLITAFHMIEHMDIISQMKLIKECFRVLKPGGMLIMETPDPANILTSTYYFHLDPTHIKIIPSELLIFTMEECGFKVVERLGLSPLEYAPYEYKNDEAISAIIFRFNMEQAYSIRAVKER